MHNKRSTYRQIIEKLEKEEALSDSEQGYSDLWQASKQFEYPESDFENQKAWDALLVQLDTSKKHSQFRLKHWYKIAASFLLILGLGWVVYDNIIHNNTESWVLETKGSETLTHELIEGTKVILSGNTKLKIHGKSKSGQRKVSLNGDAFFHVTQGPNASNNHTPFVVCYKNMEITVLGTQFRVNTYSDSTIYIAVSSGKVKVHSQNQLINTITAGNAMYYQMNQNHYQIQALKNPDQLKHVSLFYAENMKLIDVIMHLKKATEVDFQVPVSYHNVVITATLPLNNPAKAAAILSKTIGSEVVIHQ